MRRRMSASAPDRRGDELPKELQRREQRLAKIKEAKEALEAEAREAETACRAELEAQGSSHARHATGVTRLRPSLRRNGTSAILSRRS